MILLFGFAFLAGIVTVLSPCILPVLPIVLAGSVDGDKKKPLGIITGFIFSFTFFTLFLSTIVRATGLPSESLRTFSIIVIFIFGISLLIPQVQVWIEQLFSKLANSGPKQTQQNNSFWGGIVVGLSLGLLWTPCVGPILASVISLALTGSVTGSAFFITLAYALGTAIPMLSIMYGGRSLLAKVPGLMQNTRKIQMAFGILMILTAIAIFFNADRQFQTYILQKFPQYGTGLTKIEDNSIVKNQLSNLNTAPVNQDTVGKPSSDILSDLGKAPEIIPGGQWFNTGPLTLEQLRGKVVLIDFWTYSCINCIRTLPYLKDWYEKYHDKELVIIGVHSPEFEFEKKPGNVSKAIADFGIKYPVVQDNDFATWRSYNNQYWPAEYLIDKNGTIRHTHFGEGEYDQTEKSIQDLLKETGEQVNEKINMTKYDNYAQSPESYLGYERIEYLSSPEEINKDTEQTFTSPESLPVNTFSYQGKWTISSQTAMPGASALLRFNFSAKNVYLVMNPKNGITGRVKIYLDDKVITDNAGKDVTDGIVTVDTDRLYELIDLKEPGRHTLKLEFLDDNVEAFAFTFG
jgi:cytochrome c biogenesis protein CcdA/thiol-disulfide isomerase/thioredoxin